MSFSIVRMIRAVIPIIKHSFYSPRGARRGFVIALAAVCMWMGWAVGWLMSTPQTAKVQLKIQNPHACKPCSDKDEHFYQS